MKTLYEGVPPEKETLVGRCYRCSSIFEAEQDEVWIGNADSGLEHKYVCHCPVCAREIIVEMHMSNTDEGIKLAIDALRPSIANCEDYK